MAAHCQQSRGADVACVRAERDGLEQIGGVADGASDNDRNLITDALITQALINSSQRQLDRDADVVADAGRSCAGAAAVAVDTDDVCTRAGHAGSDCCYIIYGCNLDHNRLLIFGSLLQRVNQLTQVLDGVDIMMRRRRDRVRALRDHTGLGDIRANLESGQMAADTRFCALTHLDFDSSTGFEVILMYAETAGCNLHDGMRAVLVEVLMQTTLTGIIIGAERACSACECGMCVVGDRAVAHCGEHDRQVELQLRRQIGNQIAVLVTLNLARLFAEEGLGLHRLAQRVDGRIGNLRSVDENFIPVDGVRVRVAHRGQQHAARACLTVNLGDRLAGPVGVLTERVVGLYNFKGTGRAQRHAAVAGYALGLVRLHAVVVGVPKVYFVRALTLAGAAVDAAVVVADDLILRI